MKQTSLLEMRRFLLYLSFFLLFDEIVKSLFLIYIFFETSGTGRALARKLKGMGREEIQHSWGCEVGRKYHYVGVSRIQSESPGLPYGSPNLLCERDEQAFKDFAPL